MTETKLTSHIENLKSHLRTLFEAILVGSLWILMVVGFVLMMVSMWLMDNIHESYSYLFKKRLVTRPPSYWITFLRLVRIGIYKLKKKWFGKIYQIVLKSLGRL